MGTISAFICGDSLVIFFPNIQEYDDGIASRVELLVLSEATSPTVSLNLLLSNAYSASANGTYNVYPSHSW